MINFFEILDRLDTTQDMWEEIVTRQHSKQMIVDFYKKLEEETGADKYQIYGERLKGCYDNIFTNKHEELRLLDIQKIFLCKNKFCQNCQKILQAQRLDKMFNVVRKTSQSHDLYHVVFTVPNVPDYKLKPTLTLMFNSFKRMVGYFTGHHNIKGLDFSLYGYSACFRSLEITYNNERKDYHPHFHCIFALKKGLDFKKDIINKYSYSTNKALGKRQLVRKFTSFEILLQKLWRQLYDGENAKAYNKIKRTKKITKAMIYAMSIDDGYSVVADHITEEDDYVTLYEVFKYAFKLQSEEFSNMTYENFCTLLFALQNKRQIQSYGAWYNIQFDDKIDTDTIEALYLLVQEKLMNDITKESAVMTAERILEYKRANYKVISKKQVMSLLKGLTDEDRKMYANDLEALIEKVHENKKARAKARLKLKYNKSYSTNIDSKIISMEDFKQLTEEEVNDIGF